MNVNMFLRPISRFVMPFFSECKILKKSNEGKHFQQFPYNSLVGFSFYLGFLYICFSSSSLFYYSIFHSFIQHFFMWKWNVFFCQDWCNYVISISFWLSWEALKSATQIHMYNTLPRCCFTGSEIDGDYKKQEEQSAKRCVSVQVITIDSFAHFDVIATTVALLRESCMTPWNCTVTFVIGRNKLLLAVRSMCVVISEEESVSQFEDKFESFLFSEIIVIDVLWHQTTLRWIAACTNKKISFQLPLTKFLLTFCKPIISFLAVAFIGIQIVFKNTYT